MLIRLDTYEGWDYRSGIRALQVISLSQHCVTFDKIKSPCYKNKK